MALILGLDVGVNSLGWAVVDSEKQCIVDCGSRVFSEGVKVGSLNSEKEESRNVDRRNYRLSRRQHDRRKRRKSSLASRLREMGLAPKDNEQKHAFFQINPYEARVKALDAKLSPAELGRALQHLNQRRGFLSNRKTQSEDETSGTIYEGSKTGQPGINAVSEALDSGKFRTMGEYLFSLNTHEERIRRRFTARSHYRKEFDAIWKAQTQYYPDLLTDENYARIADKCIFFQRPLKSQKSKLGTCTFEKTKSKAPKSAPLSQEFRLHQSLNNLRIESPERITAEQQQLTGHEYDVLLRHLQTHDRLDLTKLTAAFKKELGFPKNSTAKFKTESILGLSTSARIRKAIGEEKFMELDESSLHNLWHVMHFAEHEEWLAAHVQDKWGYTSEESKQLAKKKLETGYMNLSSKAMRAILPFLKQGMLYHEAVEAAGYGSHSDFSAENEGAEPLLPPVRTENFRSPVVAVSLTQVRKTVNAIIRDYGKPDEIHVELARELKKPLKLRVEIEKQNRAREKERIHIKEFLQEHGISNPGRIDVLRYELWKEANQTCIYSGKPIPLHELVGKESSVEIDHILPYSRTLDNSRNNLALCYREENARKGNRTPWEAFSGNPQTFEELKVRIKTLPNPKSKRFLLNDDAFAAFMDDGEGGGFIPRQLHETAWIAKEAKQYLTAIAPHENIVVSKGMATSELRRLWELEDVIAPPKTSVNQETGEMRTLKNRDDHRHHAVDAIVIALTNRGTLQKLSTWNASQRFNRRMEAKSVLTPPWNNLRKQVSDAAANIIVSHKANRRVRGALHEETVFGIARAPLTGEPLFSEDGVPMYKTRKPLSGMTDSNPVHKIIDPIVKETVIRRLIEKGVNEADLRAGKKCKIPKDAFHEPLYMPAGEGKFSPEIKSVRICEPKKMAIALRINESGKAKDFVEPGNNHHMVIFQREHKGKLKRSSEIVTLFDAAQRIRQGLSPIQREAKEEGWELYCSLQINEMFVLNLEPDEVSFEDKYAYNSIFDQVYRVQVLTDGQITFRRHNVAILDVKLPDGSKFMPGKVRISPNVLRGFKVRISPHGRLERAYD